MATPRFLIPFSNEAVAALALGVASVIIPMAWYVRAIGLILTLGLVADLLRRPNWPTWARYFCGAILFILISAVTLPQIMTEYAGPVDAAKTERVAAAKRWIRLSDEIASEIPSIDANLSSPIIGHDVPKEIQERLFRESSDRLSRTLGESMGRMNQRYQGRIGEAVMEMKQFGINIEPRHGILLLPPGNTSIWNDWAIELGAQGRHMLTTYGVSD